jgi:hypothetical protein
MLRINVDRSSYSCRFTAYVHWIQAGQLNRLNYVHNRHHWTYEGGFTPMQYSLWAALYIVNDIHVANYDESLRQLVFYASGPVDAKFYILSEIRITCASVYIELHFRHFSLLLSFTFDQLLN